MCAYAAWAAAIELRHRPHRRHLGRVAGEPALEAPEAPLGLLRADAVLVVGAEDGVGLVEEVVDGEAEGFDLRQVGA